MPHAVWSAASPGHTRVLVGAPGGVPAVPEGWWVVRVRCDGPPRMLGPVLEAKGHVDRLVGDRTPVVELAADRVRSGLRRRLDACLAALSVWIIELASRQQGATTALTS